LRKYVKNPKNRAFLAFLVFSQINTQFYLLLILIACTTEVISNQLVDFVNSYQMRGSRKGSVFGGNAYVHLYITVTVTV